MSEPGTGPPHRALSERVGAARARADRTRAVAVTRVVVLRSDHEVVDAALEAGELDRRRAGSLLAGGVAFRMFLWLLPAALFAAGLVGLIRPTGSAQPSQVAHTLGLGASVAGIIRQATQQSHKATAILIVLGLVLMLYEGMSLVRALRIAHILAWESPFGRRPHLFRDGVILSAGALALFIGEAGLSYLRHRTGLADSLLLSILPMLAGGAAWLGMSTLLPHGEAGWTALIPGAVLFAVGLALVHLAAVYYFEPKLTKAPALYGSLGTAATLMVWLFVIARIMVASAFLNSTLWRRQNPVVAVA